MTKKDYRVGQTNAKNGIRLGGGRFRVAEKPKDAKFAAKSTLQYLEKFVPQVATALIAAVIGVLLNLFGPDQLSKITNIIEEGLPTGNVDVHAAITVAIKAMCFYVGSAFLTWLQSYTLATASRLAMRDMRNDICCKINRMPLSRFDSSSFGDLLSRVTNDVDSVGMSLNHAIVDLLTAAVTFVGCLVMMLTTNVLLTAIAFVCGVAGMLVMKVMIKKSQPFFSARSRYMGEINGHVEEMYAGHIVVKANNGDRESKEEFERINGELYKNNWISQFLSGVMHPIIEFLGNLGYVSVCVVGCIMVQKGLIRFGTVIAFVLYVRQFTMPLGQVAQSVTSIQSALAGAERIFGFLGEPEMEDESKKEALLQNVQGTVEFDHVRFGYEPDKTIIHDFSVKVEPGMKVAIVGPTGAGKTTLVNLLMRFYDVNSGAIKIDGVDTYSVPRTNVHDQFCMVLQDTWIFEGTIKENIAYCVPGVTDEDVIDACKQVGLHHYFSSLPQGYDTMLTDESSLSEGQKQLLTIARAMVSKCPLLILDEATSSVDTRTEQLVQNAMDKLTEGRTSFTIAHRLSTIRNADIILVMRNGDIVETGTHNELLEKGGFYSELWTSQFVNAEAI